MTQTGRTAVWREVQETSATVAEGLRRVLDDYIRRTFRSPDRDPVSAGDNKKPQHT